MVVGDAIRCLGHNLEFDLATGTCLNARCDPLVTRSLVRVASEAVDSPEMEGF
jgi:nitrite reductase/ring-hydroxylating ferredoxin subunit